MRWSDSESAEVRRLRRIDRALIQGLHAIIEQLHRRQAADEKMVTDITKLIRTAEEQLEARHDD